MITGILVIAAFAIAVVIGIIYFIFSSMVFPSQEETADKGYQLKAALPVDGINSSQEETADKGYQGETENFISRKTVLYVSVNGIWKESRFLRFDIKNGKKVVYVNCGGTESFYAYPSKYVKTKYEDVKKANAEKKIKESKYIPENLEAIAIANAYKKYPASHRPSEIAENEKEHELEYHSRVDKKLDELDDAAHAQLSEAYDLERKSRDTLRQAYIDERESDAGFDPFNMGFLYADSYHAASARIERKAHEELMRYTRPDKNHILFVWIVDVLLLIYIQFIWVTAISESSLLTGEIAL